VPFLQKFTSPAPRAVEYGKDDDPERRDAMQKHVNVTIPLACPHCLAEMLTTIDEVQQEATIQCAACGTAVELFPKNLPTAGLHQRLEEQAYFGIRF
jgi:DNA-directed RNA polymerase subunit RPC12/RpoP